MLLAYQNTARVVLSLNLLYSRAQDLEDGYYVLSTCNIQCSSVPQKVMINWSLGSVLLPFLIDAHLRRSPKKAQRCGLHVHRSSSFLVCLYMKTPAETMQ